MLSNKNADNKSPRRTSYLQNVTKNNGGIGLIKLNDMSVKDEERGASFERRSNDEQSPSTGKYKDQNQNTNETKTFQNGKETLKFEEFLSMIKDNCSDPNQTENFLVLAFSMFDR